MGPISYRFRIIELKSRIEVLSRILEINIFSSPVHIYVYIHRSINLHLHISSIYLLTHYL